MWFTVNNVETVDSPALLAYPDRIAQNIRTVKQMTGSTAKLRIHVKTNKTPEVCQMMLDAGIVKYKCATIAEAEMLGQIVAPDVLLAYQPVGPKIYRLAHIVKAYPQTNYSCLVDNLHIAREVSDCFAKQNKRMDVFIDLNVGMNRTGILPSDAPHLIREISNMKGIRVKGIHAYDGHIHDTDLTLRTQKADEAFSLVEQVVANTQDFFIQSPVLILGGSPTFPVHCQRENVECSPGTFIFWDWGYRQMFPDQPFEYAAILLSRVISVIDRHTVCIDLGHKSIAAENPLPRIYFLNAPDAKPFAQSEEHLTVQVPDSSQYPVGSVLYGVPVHICPTVALYDRLHIVIGHHCAETWEITARKRNIFQDLTGK